MANAANSVINLTLAVTDRLSPAVQFVGKNISVLANQASALSSKFLELSASAGTFLAQILEVVGSLPQGFNELVASLEAASPILDDLVAQLEDIGQYSTQETFSGIGLALSQGLSLASPAFRSISQSVNGLVGQISQKLYPAITLIDQGILKIANGASDLTKKSADLSGKLAGVFGFLSGAREPLVIFDLLRGSIGKVSGGIFSAVQELGFFSLGIQSLQQLVQAGPFQALIGQNEELRQQLLATQATLASTSRIVSGGVEVSDPTQAIQSLSVPVKNAIADLRKGSLDLVGVTSKDLVPIFQVVAGQITQIGGGLNDATSLTLSFAAALGTMGVPLFQANQEIRSIVTGTIDQNSIIAQNLNLTNQQVEKWKAQGTLIQELTKRLEGFRAGNALSAQSISGITSNIQEVFDEITRIAGEPLLGPIVKELDAIYKGLKENTQAYSDYIGGLAANGLKAVLSFVDAGKTLAASTGEALSKIPVYAFETIAGGAKSFAEGLKAALVFLQPFINLFAQLVSAAVSASGPFFTLFLQFKLLQGGIGLVSGGLSTLAQIIPGLGEIMFLLQGRTSGVLGTFLGLQKGIGPLPAILLVLGQRLGSIGPLSDALARSFPLIGGALARQIPLFANFGVAIAGAAAKSPILAELLNRISVILGTLTGQSVAGAGGIGLLSRSFGALVAMLARLVTSAGLPLLGQQLDALSAQLTRGTVATNIFRSSIGTLRTSIVSFLTGTVAMTAAFALAAIAFDKFILKNQTLMTSLQGFGSFLADLATSIFNFLTNPFTLATLAAQALAAAIVSQTIPAIQALVAQALLGGLANLATRLSVLAGTLSGLNLLGMATSAAQASRGVTLLASAASSGSLGLAAFSQGLGAIALGLAGILAPLALVAAGIAAIGLIRYTKDLKESGEAFEIYREQSNAVADDALGVAAKLKTAADRTAEAQKTGIALTAQEIAANAKLAQSGKLRLANLEEQIKVLKLAAAEAKGPYKESFETQIAMLEATRKALEKYINTVQILPRSLPKLGDSFDQLEQKAIAAQKAIANPVGDVEVFKKKVEEYQQVTQQQVAIGAISLAEAERRYREIAGLATLEVDAQIKASEAAIAARKEQLKRETDLTSALVEQRKAAIAAGSIEEYSGYAEIFKLQQKDLQNQKKSIEQALVLEQKAGRGSGKIAKDLFLEKKSLETQLTTIATEQLNKRIELESRYLSIAQSRIADTIAQAEQSSLKQTQDLLNEGAKTQVEADQLRANSTRDRLQKELAAELAYQQGLENLPQAKTEEKQEERERAIRASKLKTAQLTTQLSEQQQRDQEALTKVIQEQITKQQKGIQNLAERQNQAYTKQIELLGRLNTALEFQNKLIDARKGLQGAIGDYLQTEYKILIETAKTDEEKQRLTQKAAETELRFLGQRQALDRESLEVKLKIQKAEDARALAQNQVDQITSAAAVKSAQADLAKAKADPKTTPEELEALQLGIEAANAKLGAEQFKGQSLGAQTVFNQQQESTQRRTLALQQSGELDQKRFEYGKTLSPEQQEGFLNKLRNEIYQRLSKDKAIAPTDPTQNGPYTPTVYTGTFDAKTGVYTPSPESSTARTSRAVNVTSAELPQLKDLLQGTVNFSNILKEQVDFRPANQALKELVTLSREGNGILLMVANDPKQEITTTTYNQTLERRDRSNRGLPR